jgi:hypothetical protein
MSRNLSQHAFGSIFIALGMIVAFTRISYRLN